MKRSPWYSVLALAAALVWILPSAWMASTSLKPLREIAEDPTAPLPKHPQIDAYREVFAQIPVGRYMVVSVGMAAVRSML